jgi:hypothetical protein
MTLGASNLVGLAEALIDSGTYCEFWRVEPVACALLFGIRSPTPNLSADRSVRIYTVWLGNPLLSSRLRCAENNQSPILNRSRADFSIGDVVSNRADR